MQAFSTAMSEVSVEWLFGDIVESFKFIDFRKNQKLGMTINGMTNNKAKVDFNKSLKFELFSVVHCLKMEQLIYSLIYFQ